MTEQGKPVLLTEAGNAAKSLPPIDELRALLRYEPETGKLFWLARRTTSIAAGDEAGSLHNGYLRISINRRKRT